MPASALASHLCGMLFMSAIDTDLTTVPYKGTGPAMNDLLGGQVDFMCDQTTNTTSQIKAGKIKVYAVTTKTRVPSLPERADRCTKPGLPGFEVAVWHGLYAPKGTPKPVIDKLARGAPGRAQGPDASQQRFADLGAEPVSENRATPGGAARAPEGRDRQVGADHQEGRRLRRLISGKLPQQEGGAARCDATWQVPRARLNGAFLMKNPRISGRRHLPVVRRPAAVGIARRLRAGHGVANGAGLFPDRPRRAAGS